MTVTPLHPTSTDDQRWRPARAGIVNLWRYADETFTFHRGRLLLRGPNGSGKSMALELLLPFLLDADASPSRLSSATKSRGGLYERVMTGTNDSTRAGFAWVEFRRGIDVFTVGARMRASTSVGRKVDLRFFTTSLAIGGGLHLLNANRQPLSIKELEQALADRGAVHESGDDHRRAVRDVLYPDFTPDRYQAVIGALLALRKEKISQNLDPVALSKILSDALPPLEDHELAAVAEGFERLDRRRAELAALEAELAEVRALEGRQRAYARSALAAASEGVRRAHTRRDDVTRAERGAQESLTGAESERDDLLASIEVSGNRVDSLNTEIEALHDSDAYRDGAALDDLRREAHRLRELLTRDSVVAQREAETEERRALELRGADDDVAAAAANAAAASAQLERDGETIGGRDLVADAIAMVPPDDGERLMRAWVDSRVGSLTEVRAACASHAKAVLHREWADEQERADADALDTRVIAAREAARALQDAVDEFVGDVRVWSVACETTSSARVSAALPPLPDDPDAVAAAIARLSAEIDSEIATGRRRLDDDRAALKDERAALDAARGELVDGVTPEPDLPSWRTPVRVGIGAPLWRLVDVRGGNIDGVEAALLASGLLDAWVDASGTTSLPDGAADVVLGTRHPATGTTLLDVLAPVDDGPVDADVIANVLGAIAVRDGADDGGDVVIARDGSFRIGAAVGRGAVRPAGFLGAAAQERRRRTRIAELDDAIASIDRRLGDIDVDATALDRRAAAVAAELAAVPDGRSVRDTTVDLRAAETRVSEAEARMAESRERRVAAEDRVRGLLRALTQLASRHGLPTDDDGLAEVEHALRRLADSAGVWARRARELGAALRGRDRAAAERGAAQAAAATAVASLAESGRQAGEVATRLATLEQSVGATYQALLDRIDGARAERGDEERAQKAANARLLVVTGDIGRLGEELAHATSAREEAEQERASAHDRFVALVGDGLADDGSIEVGDISNATAVLVASRELGSALEKVPSSSADVDRAASRVQEQVHHARAALGSRVEVSLHLTDGGWWVLRGSTGGVRRTIAALGAALDHELGRGRDELAADEERLFEQTLAGSIRRALAERIRRANELVDAINDQLAAVRTAAGGVEIRLKWEVDPEQPESVRSARSLLLRDPHGLSDEERGALQSFVRARVDQARAELEVAAPWEARLRETLDYRSWHRFSLLLAHRDWDGFQPATSRRLQRLSTGERSIALHLPMLASIAAHYAGDDGAPRSCPRLILLDELFAGVDRANRAKLFGTFVVWDLDAVLTSDHEWCEYNTLDGIAIHHLHPADGDEPVTSTRFTWDGHQRGIDPAA